MSEATTKKEFKPNPGIGYRKIAKSGVNYLSVQLDLAAMGVGTGKINLVGFPNDNKTTERHPDIIFRLKKPAGETTAPAVAAVATPASKPIF